MDHRNHEGRQRINSALRANTLFLQHARMRRELENVPELARKSLRYADRCREFQALNRQMAALGLTN